MKSQRGVRHRQDRVRCLTAWLHQRVQSLVRGRQVFPSDGSRSTPPAPSTNPPGGLRANPAQQTESTSFFILSVVQPDSLAGAWAFLALVSQANAQKVVVAHQQPE